MPTTSSPTAGIDSRDDPGVAAQAQGDEDGIYMVEDDQLPDADDDTIMQPMDIDTADAVDNAEDDSDSVHNAEDDSHSVHDAEADAVHNAQDKSDAVPNTEDVSDAVHNAEHDSRVRPIDPSANSVHGAIAVSDASVRNASGAACGGGGTLNEQSTRLLSPISVNSGSRPGTSTVEGVRRLRPNTVETNSLHLECAGVTNGQHLDLTGVADGEPVPSSADKCQSLKKAIDSLSGSSWLNDDAINYVLDILVTAKPSWQHLHSAHVTMDEPRRMLQRHHSLRINPDVRMLLVPLHQGQHWTVATLDLDKGWIKYYNSLASAKDFQEAESALQIFGETLSKSLSRCKTLRWVVSSQVG